MFLVVLCIMNAVFVIRKSQSDNEMVITRRHVHLPGLWSVLGRRRPEQSTKM